MWYGGCECELSVHFVLQEMKTEVNGLQSQTDYMYNIVDRCRANKMTGRLTNSLADSITSTIERHDKLRADIDDTLSQIELAQSNVDDFEVRCDYTLFI